eukprot:CAMPEP_0119287976 /NCGR_PEP_ID=MMETSP1329-20130426/36458_1 /TAXON_ID=114041 /ORGANISM="Genus nov. species nov., Strain RCC1024" /LENGTH=101 /DNA_ID=CAMNT_0007288753 /DNA_START=58 /DNA_END=359 /DNA_ORIENTATION=+
MAAPRSRKALLLAGTILACFAIPPPKRTVKAVLPLRARLTLPTESHGNFFDRSDDEVIVRSGGEEVMDGGQPALQAVFFVLAQTVVLGIAVGVAYRLALWP